MTDPELPADLSALERRLAARSRPEPPADLGPRVLAACRDVLRGRPAGGWRSWGAVAAAVLLGINLSMSVTADTDWGLRPGVEPAQMAATADRLRALAPDLPESEVRRQALLIHAGAGLTPAVEIDVDLGRYHTTKELEQWDER